MATEQLSGTIACTSKVFGGLSGNFVALIGCSSSLTGELRADAVMAADVLCTSSLSGSISGLTGLTGSTVACSSTVTGNVQMFIDLEGETIACAATFTPADMQGKIIYLSSHVIRS
jgi:hypothetical protein